MTAYLPILAMGAFGVVLAIVSHFSLSRERKALLEARARLAEAERGEGGADGKSGQALSQSATVLANGAGGRMARMAPKQYRRVREKA